MADYDRSAASVGYVHATVTLGGEGKMLAAELERMRVAGLVDRVNVEVIVPRARLDPTPEAKRLPPIRDGEASAALTELSNVEHRLASAQVQYVADLVRRFAAITE